MSEYRIKQHPILEIPVKETLQISWKGQMLTAVAGETIAAALFANGIHVFGHHPKDHSPQGIFCANGQCAQCLVIANGKPVKACMERVAPGMRIEPVDGLAELPKVSKAPRTGDIPQLKLPVLIVGGGPAGLSAAIELGKLGVQALLIDDKPTLGGKLVLQTHRFFGSSQAVYAGTRGIDIAGKLSQQLAGYPSISVWLSSTALAVFSDGKVGVLRGGDQYILVSPEVLLVATGAREKFLTFPGNTLPGVYGAGAFQTLVNRDLVLPSKKLFIVGGGNVGLIAGYHALQAGIQVVGLVEALPDVGGYKVHRDKLVRMGVPVYTSHTILSANGKDCVESITIAQVNEQFQPVPGSQRSYDCDSILIAVGLDPVNEFYQKAVEYGMQAISAGDAEEIAEASAAIYSGKIRGVEIAQKLGYTKDTAPRAWYETAEILKSKPGETHPEQRVERTRGVLPVIHCNQEIPCDPCAALCQEQLITIDPQDIRSLPVFTGDETSCKFCERCVAGCPGLAITLVDYRQDAQNPRVAIPYEFSRGSIQKGDMVTVLDTTGNPLGAEQVINVHSIKTSDRTLIVHLRAPSAVAHQIAGIRIQETAVTEPLDQFIPNIKDDAIICRCERVSAAEIRNLIRQGYRDLNEIKVVSRAGLGACGSKTCAGLILRLFRDEGVPLSEVTLGSRRPLFVEVPLKSFAGVLSGADDPHE